MKPDEIYYRWLPHWRLHGATYFVTWRVRRGQPDLLPEERAVVFRALQVFDGERYRLLACVVMNDHVHALVAPMAEHRLEAIVHSWKSFTSNAIKRLSPDRNGSVWLAEYFDRIMRDEAELLQKLHYITNNPHKRWPDIESYEWVMPEPSLPNGPRRRRPPRYIMRA